MGFSKISFCRFGSSQVGVCKVQVSQSWPNQEVVACYVSEWFWWQLLCVVYLL